MLLPLYYIVILSPLHRVHNQHTYDGKRSKIYMAATHMTNMLAKEAKVFALLMHEKRLNELENIKVTTCRS